MVLVSVTRLHLKSPRYFPVFLWHTALSSWQIMNTPGFLGGKLTSDQEGGAWTISFWEDESGMRQYRNSGAHRQAMRYLPHWCDEATVVHWKQEDTNLPDAIAVHSRIESEGHFTKVLHPSIAHQNRQIPEPLLPNGIPLHPRKKNSADHNQFKIQNG
jgi:heme-degrading monooxygenase HmoA